MPQDPYSVPPTFNLLTEGVSGIKGVFNSCHKNCRELKVGFALWWQIITPSNKCYAVRRDNDFAISINSKQSKNSQEKSNLWNPTTDKDWYVLRTGLETLTLDWQALRKLGRKGSPKLQCLIVKPAKRWYFLINQQCFQPYNFDGLGFGFWWVVRFFFGEFLELRLKAKPNTTYCFEHWETKSTK